MSELDIKKVAQKNNPQTLIEELVIIAEILQDSNIGLREENMLLRQTLKALGRELRDIPNHQCLKSVNDQKRVELKPLPLVTQYDCRKKTGFAIKSIKESVTKNTTKLK